ncbi:MAG: thiamine-phosphate kinase [Burkholderiales bacterium]
MAANKDMAGEFDIIRRFFTHPARNAILGVGDDAALIVAAPEMELAISTDVLVAGTHFFAGADPRRLGHKALAVNLSDMAAMGAAPHYVTLSLTIPAADESWLREFSSGFMALAHAHGVELVGGDTSRGPLNIGVQIVGEVPKGQALRRVGAKVGDDIWVSGTLGDAALALAHLLEKIALVPDDLARCETALHTPVARVELGQRLRGIASSAIDISDGLIADLTHILDASRLAALIELEKIPRSVALNRQLPSEIGLRALLAGGDDYELCFTCAAAERARVLALSRELELPLTRIGRAEAGCGLTIRDTDGRVFDYEAMKMEGFDHFG